MSPSPANPQATPTARALLALLHERSQRSSGPLSAQHDYLTSVTRYRDELTSLIGRPPAIYGSDFSFDYAGPNPETIVHCGPANFLEPGHDAHPWTFAPEKVFSPESPATLHPGDLHTKRMALVERCIALHRAGSHITLMWHAPTPDRGHTSGAFDLWHHGHFPNTSWAELLTPGTTMHSAWLEQVDTIAGYLAILQHAEVPILWRPYHEMNGGWFWWGQRNDPKFPFAKLWRQLFDRFVNHHQLHHLLWVWNANAPRTTPGDEAGPYSDYYPGGDYVDILATDVYHNDYRASHYTDLLALADGRPVALGEVGHLPTPKTLDQQPRWSWIMPWGGLVFRFNPRETIETYSHHLDRP